MAPDRTNEDKSDLGVGTRAHLDTKTSEHLDDAPEG